VPPFVHDGFVPDMAFEPADAAAHGTVTLVVEPAAAAVAPAAPGSAVWSFANDPAGAVNADPEIMFSHGFANVVAPSPTAIRNLLHLWCPAPVQVQVQVLVLW
jgi:hypothetical protein